MILPLLNLCWKLFDIVSRPRQSDAKKASPEWDISLAFLIYGITEDPGVSMALPCALWGIGNLLQTEWDFNTETLLSVMPM